MYNIAIISGDGIGKEVMSACEYLLDKLDLEFSFKYGEAGFECFNKNGATLPEETIRIANESDAVLFGASTSTPGQPSPIINLRKELNVYANIRPIKSYKGVNCIRDDIDFVIVRENTEGLYSQVEYGDDNKMIAERVITKKASERISKAAFNLCIKRGQSKVTCVHKSNVLKKTDGVFKESFYKVAQEYPQITSEDYYVDAMAMYLITQPQNFDVIVSSNLFGDILSDESAGQHIANPCSMILSASMMLDYLGEWEISNDIKNAVEKVIADCKIRTPDLGGNSCTMDVTKAIVKELI